MSSYQVIARKYRPQKFSDVVGQEHVTTTLMNAIKQKRIAHAYLFVGPRGTGKTTIARIFAKALNCVGGPKWEFGEDDPNCQQITEGRSLDVLEIDGASNRGIEEIRALRETVRYAPASSTFKIYIIDEVHMLTKEAFNALLKTLEEPPEHVKFMFATTEPEKVLPTILSRCQRFDLRRIPSTLIVKHLGEIAAKEGVEIEEAALYAIARGAEGGMRDAESTLDQLISFCGEKIVESDVLSMFGLAARAQILGLAGAVLDGRVQAVLRELNELAQGGKDLGRLLSDLLGHFRNLLIYQIAGGDTGLLEVSEAEATAIEEQAKGASAEQLTRIMEVLSDGEGRLKEASSKKILVEITLLKAVQARQAMSIDAVIGKLKELQGSSAQVTGGGPAAGSGNFTTEAQKAQRPEGKAPVQAMKLEEAPRVEAQAGEADVEHIWTQVVEAASKASPFARVYLMKAHAISMVGRVLTVGLDPEFADEFPMLDSPKNRALVQTKLQELGLGDLAVKFVMAETPAGRGRARTREEAPALDNPPAAPPPKSMSAPAAKPAESQKAAPVQLSKEDFKNDPLIKRALEIFRGTIVEVRA